MNNTITVRHGAVRVLTRACEKYFENPSNQAAFEQWKAEKAKREKTYAESAEPKEIVSQFIARMSVRDHKYNPGGAR
ncbi:MAG: hypothetical protein ACI3YH_00235 [Eubacteriales bacterium]